MKKKIIFRADGNTDTGLGHLYRLFALVEIFKESYDYLYLTSESSAIEVIPKDYNVDLISKDIGLLDEPNWLSEKYDAKNHIIIADGYHFTSNYQKRLKELGFSVVYVDDLVKEHMYADIVINHSSSCQVSDFKSESYTRFALGTKFSLLRPAFLDLAKKSRIINEIDKVFICFGGADKFDFSLKTVKILLEINRIEKIYVVLGGAYKGDEIRVLKNKFPDRIEIHKNLSEKELISVMKICNLAIVPTSTILYELLCVKMPIISGYFVDNQMSVYHWFNENGCFYGVGDFCDFDFEKLKDIIQKFEDQSLVQSHINNQARCIDGNQKDRFLQLIKSL